MATMTKPSETEYSRHRKYCHSLFFFLGGGWVSWLVLLQQTEIVLLLLMVVVVVLLIIIMVKLPSHINYNMIVFDFQLKRRSIIILNSILFPLIPYIRTVRFKKERLSWISLLNGISTFLDYLMPKPALWKNNSYTIQPITAVIKGFSTRFFAANTCLLYMRLTI